MRVLKAHTCTQMKKHNSKKAKIDVKAYKLSNFIGILPGELSDLLQAVFDHQMTFDEASDRAVQMKLIHKNQKFFCEETSCESWIDAMNKYDKVF